MAQGSPLECASMGNRNSRKVVRKIDAAAHWTDARLPLLSGDYVYATAGGRWSHGYEGDGKAMKQPRYGPGGYSKFDACDCP